jgi:tRNA threonylcarbamoyladenosine modification (KEOPS) complex Cgi121 subunit
MAVPALTNRSKIWTTTKKQKAKIEIAEMKLLRGCIWKNQIRNTKIREELNIVILNAKIIKSRSQWKHNMQ